MLKTCRVCHSDVVLESSRGCPAAVPQGPMSFAPLVAKRACFRSPGSQNMWMLLSRVDGIIFLLWVLACYAFLGFTRAGRGLPAHGEREGAHRPRPATGGQGPRRGLLERVASLVDAGRT